MALENIAELEALGRVVNVSDKKGGYILTINLHEDKTNIAPGVVTDYFSKMNISLNEFAYSKRSRELSVKYHLPISAE